jgi:glycerate 2-kinase
VIALADVARAMFAAAVDAVQPDALLRRVEFTPTGIAFDEARLEPAGRLVLVALGWAGPSLADAFIRRAQRPPDTTFVLAPDGCATPVAISPFVRRAAHPVPDRRGDAATSELLNLLSGLSQEDGVVVLLSGGTAALLARPLRRFTLKQVAELTQALLGCGATTRELATVRRHTLAAGGGRLAAACRAPVLSLVVSDYPDDDLPTIASGPTVPNPTLPADARAVLERHGLESRFPEIVAALRQAEDGADDSPESGRPSGPAARTAVLASSAEALSAAARCARDAGLEARVLTRRLSGEARRVGQALGGLAAALAPGEGVALLASGTTSVTVLGDGCGGPNLELALAAAQALEGVPERCLLACSTNGLDGTSPASGAVVDGATSARAAARGRDAETALASNNAWGFFAGLPEAIVTGTTGTHVADLVFLLVAGG